MKVVVIGGGPAGFYTAILLKKKDPSHEIHVLERNGPDDTFGFGVVFSDATLENLQEADEASYRRITDGFHHWDDIETHYRGETLISGGHGFCGISRQGLLTILSERASELGVQVHYGVEFDPATIGQGADRGEAVGAGSRLDADAAGANASPGAQASQPASLGGAAARETSSAVLPESVRRNLEDVDLWVAADGVNSAVREHFRDRFHPSVDWRPNRFVWLGTSCPFPAFTFYFKENEHGLWRVHAYQYEPERSTFIVEATDETFRKSGLEEAAEDATVEFCEKLFADELNGHRLLKNRSVWRRFPTIKNEKWSFDRLVLLGDAAHTAHFSVGSGTKLAMEDAITLVESLETESDLHGALKTYEEERRSDVESLQRAAQASLHWFEDTERYMESDPIEFGFNLLTRSLRITHTDLKVRDPDYIEKIDRWFAGRAEEQSGVPVPARSSEPIPPPMFTPFRLRDLVFKNRVVVSAMCQYSAMEGVPNDWHFQHLASRAVGGAGLLFTEMVDVSETARITPGCAGIYTDEQRDAWRRIVDFVHQYTSTKIALQLAHAGRKGSTRVAWEGMDEPLHSGGWDLLAPSAVPWFAHSPVPKEMDRADMDTVRDDFIEAALRASDADFDMIELHFAHGYLLGSFLSPLTNLRTDEYGGSLENRLRFPLEILDRVRRVWPREKPLSVRISATDWAPGGVDARDAVEIARHLKAHDVDIVDVSAGQTVPYQKPVYGRQFQTPFSDRIRREVGIPTIAVGNISSYMDVNTIVASGRADLCALARAHLWDPYWTRNAAQKQGYPLPWPGPYSSLDRYSPRFE